jgi:phosphate transport system substrate-binding protein
VSGSSAPQPLVNAAKEKYEAAHHGASDIFAPDDLKSKLVDHKVAVVGFAAMANKGPFNEKVHAITQDQLAKVFEGQIKDWKELGGEAQPIVVINRAAGSGTRAVFGNVVLGGDKFVEARTEDNSGALVAKLKQTKGAVSYLALSFKDDELVTLSLKTDAGVVHPTEENITAGKYPIWSYEHMFTSGPPSGSAKQFLDYKLSPAFQKDVPPKVKGFIPVVDMKVSRDKD